LLAVTGFGQATERGRVSEDLGRLALRKVLFDRNQHRLLHAAVLNFSYLLELILDLRRQP
jgi:hypothetical protein